MAVDPTKKPEEQTQPSAPQEATAVEQTAPITPMEVAMAPYANEIGSISSQIDALNEQREKQDEEVARLQKNWADAKQQGYSLIGSLVEKQKPQYDAKKEQRMRNAAIIQSLGDVLSAAARGYFAYNKKGAGVVPNVVQSNALEGVNKITEMQEKYLREKKAWDELDFKWKQAQNAADVEAAEALLSNAQGVRDRIDGEIERLRERGIKITDKVRDTVASAIISEMEAEADIQREREQLLWEKKNNVGRGKVTYRGGGGGGRSGAKATTQSDYAKIYARLNGGGYGEKEDGETYKWNDLLEDEKTYWNDRAQNDMRTNIYISLLNQGIDPNEHIDLINKAAAYYGDDMDALTNDMEAYGVTFIEALQAAADTYDMYGVGLNEVEN